MILPVPVDQHYKMVFRMMTFLLGFVVIVGGVDSAATGEKGHYGDSEWPGGISPLDSLSYWRKDEREKSSDADDKRPCCPPMLWTGRLFAVYRLEGPEGRTTYRYLQIVYYDQVNKRLADDIIVGNTTFQSRILLFNKTGATQYTFSKTTKQCRKQFLSGAQLSTLCIPPDATLLRSFSLGADSEALKTQSWSYGYRDSYTDSAFDVSVTPGSCIPVISSFTATYLDAPTKKPSQLNIETLFTDMKTHIADQSVFAPPSFCKMGGEGKDDEDDDEKLYFDHHDFHINTII